MARFRLALGPDPAPPPGLPRPARPRWTPASGAGDRLPPERELAERYGCSLITVRRALSELAREERLERTRGRGTFVLRPRIERDFGGSQSFTEEMQSRGLDPETRLVASHPEVGGRGGRRTRSDLELGSPTLYLERLRLAAGEPLLLEQVHLPAERFPGLLASDLEHDSLYDLLDRALRDARRPGPRGARAGPAARPRGRACSGSPAARPRCSSKASPTPPTGSPSSSAGRFVRGDRTRYYVERVVVRQRPLVDRPGGGAGRGCRHGPAGRAAGESSHPPLRRRREEAPITRQRRFRASPERGPQRGVPCVRDRSAPSPSSRPSP